MRNMGARMSIDGSCVHTKRFQNGALTLVVLGLGLLTTRYWDTELPVWGFIVVCFGLAVLLIVPEGILRGTTNQRVFLNIISEMIAGCAWPGNPISNLMVKCYGYNAVKHGMDFAQDLKLGQNMVSFYLTLFELC
jgi:hypothetical protein